MPEAFAGTISLQAHQKAAQYTLAKSRFGALAGVFDTLVLAMVVFGGVLPHLFATTSAWAPPAAMWDDALFLFLAGVLLSVPGLPFDWWAQFRLETKFGFNKST